MLKGLIQSRNTREEKDLQNQPQTVKKMAIRTHISIITLNVKGLNAPTKRHRLAEWIQKQDPYICCLQDPFQISRHMQTESERIEKYITCKWEAKQICNSNPHIKQNRP